MKKRRASVRSRVAPIVLTVVTACSTAAPEHTAFQRSLGIDVSSREIRIRTTEFAMNFSQVVEIAADSILTLTQDRSIARNALVWKSYAVPAVYRSATLPDPLMAWIDCRVLTYQMRDYFISGEGKNLFGDLQPLAVEATQFLEDQLERATELSGQNTDPDLEDSVRGFAAENPLTNAYFFRPSPVDLLASHLGQTQASGLQAVGSITELMEEMSMRLNTYTELLPRAGRWQAELMLADLADPERSAMYLDVLSRLEVMQTLNDFLLNTPHLVEEQRKILLEAVEYQRGAFETALGRYVAGATDEILAGLTPEREAALADLERVLHGEISDAVTRLDGSISQAVVDIDGALESAVDRLFVRLLELVAIVGAVAVLLAFLLRGRFVPVKAE